MKFKDWRGDLKRTEILRGWAGQGRRLSGKETGAPGCFAFLRSRALWVLHVDPPFSPACPPAGARFEELLVSVDLAEGAGVLGGGQGSGTLVFPVPNLDLGSERGAIKYLVK